jgi:hypothetical protein
MSKEIKKEEEKTSKAPKIPQVEKPIKVISYSKIGDDVDNKAKLVNYSDGSSKVFPIDSLPAIGSEKV